MLQLRNARVFKQCILLCMFFGMIVFSESFKLNVPSILITYNTGLPSNYTLEVTDFEPEDCFFWHSTNVRIVQIVPIYDNAEKPTCSRKAIITSASNFDDRKVTRVTAYHTKAESVHLDCDVITDSIATIELMTTTNELSIGGPPLLSTVVAKNKLGNVFTSINGLLMDWSVTVSSEESSMPETDEVRRIPCKIYSDSFAYTYPKSMQAWQSRGIIAQSVFVEGVSVGTVYIGASVLNLKSKEMHTPKVAINVLPNLKISPSEQINLLQHASLEVFLETIEQGKLKRLEPSNFKKTLKDATVIEGDEEFSKVFGKEHGATSISFESINNSYPDMVLDLHVVKPAFLTFRISGGGFKILQEMKTYQVNVDIFDADNNKIHPSDNLRMMVTFPTKLFHVSFASLNGTYHIVQAIAPGSGKIRAAFQGVLKEDGVLSKGPSISAIEQVSVCQRLSIFPPYMFLPYDKSIMPHKVPLKASGGNGDYIWAVNKPDVAFIIPDGKDANIAELHVHNESNLVVTVTDKSNINIFASAKVSVQPIIDIETYPTVVEAEIENTLIIQTALLGYDSKDTIRKFDDCSKTEPSVEIIEKHVLTYEKEAQIPSFGKGCLTLQFRCKYPGYSRVNIMYNGSDNSVRKTTTVLSCFKPLKPVHPVRVAVLALGTSKEVAFEGGPRRWPLFKEGHKTELLASDSDLVDIEIIKDPVRYNKDLTVFRVTCKALGENTLAFRIGNEKSATNYHPAKAEASIKFICSEPASVHLKLTKKKNSKQLLDESIVKVPFYGNKEFSVDVWLKDSMGRKFANISSLHLEWEVSDRTLAQPESNEGFTTHDNAVSGYRKITRDFKEFKMTGATGNLKVGAKVMKYKPEVLAKIGVVDYNEISEISQSIDLKLVSLRDLNADQYVINDKQELEEHCDEDSCQN